MVRSSSLRTRVGVAVALIGAVAAPLAVSAPAYAAPASCTYRIEGGDVIARTAPAAHVVFRIGSHMVRDTASASGVAYALQVPGLRTAHVRVSASGTRCTYRVG